MKENMEIWKWEGGLNGWFTTDKYGVGMGDSLSVEMESLNLRHLWEKPIETLKSVGDRFCEACSNVTGFKQSTIAQQRAAVRKRLYNWASSIEVAIMGRFKIMERVLNDEDQNPESSFNQQSTYEAPNLHLVSLGYIKNLPIASRSTVLDKADAIQNVARTVTLRVGDFEGNRCNLIDRHMELRVVLMYDDGEECDVSVSRAPEMGEYNICFKASRPGHATLSVKLHGVDVAGSPSDVTVHPTKDWNVKTVHASFFGAEGVGPGMFERPWGVGCDRQGRLLVADRSNNRVQVFKDNGKFLFEFGKKGTELGEFQLVTSVVGAPNGDLICVDKDNHRIQVFNEEGHFKFAFGEFGEKEGQFQYPWDADVNARGEIVVSDTRNSRIQLFTPHGKFVKDFGRNDFPELDSPRGVSFMNTNEVVVTDFNKHCLVIVNLRTKKHSVICCEGSGAGQLRRPQGVAWHPDGFFVVADSRNNRIQAVDRSGAMVWETDATKQCIRLNKPCGVAMSMKGQVVAIDFGNNRAVIVN